MCLQKPSVIIRLKDIITQKTKTKIYQLKKYFVGEQRQKLSLKYSYHCIHYSDVQVKQKITNNNNTLHDFIERSNKTNAVRMVKTNFNYNQTIYIYMYR